MEIINIIKKYYGNLGSCQNVINEISFKIDENSVNTILAPSDSGKTTLLKIIAGLESIDGGEIKLEPFKKIVYIPTQPSFLHWFSVKENFSLINENQDLQKEIIMLLGLDGYEKHYLNEKSIGFQFLVSFGMALLSGSDLVLVDEPFTGASKLIKERICKAVRETVKKRKISILIATSNLSDAFLFSDSIFLMKGTPLDIVEKTGFSLKGERRYELLNSKEAGSFQKRAEDFFKNNKTGGLISF